ncbi:MAG TPA: hypothetical protein VLT57_16550 [Bryobacteraceae bacterium]|jgi:hypothetical protein|nr:hypothetical protein [Bryobacteraceae bacterium]
MSLGVRSKNRIINFRVTEDEYRVIHHLWQENGARSLSDCVRSLVLGCASGDLPQMDDRFAALEARIRSLELSALGASVAESGAESKIVREVARMEPV